MSHYTGSVPAARRGADWRDPAACREKDTNGKALHDPELFFPVGETGPALLQTQEAKAVCRRCPVMEQCLQWALECGQDFGVWGGLSEGERRKVRRRAARSVIDFGDIDAEIRKPKTTKPGRNLKTIWLERSVVLREGHIAWSGGPSISYQGRTYTARQVAFTVNRGRQPDGPVHRECGVDGCVQPEHLTDEQERALRAFEQRRAHRAASG